jgi:hypothetical protein
MAAFDAKKLSPLDWAVGGAGLLALISLFLPWWGASFGPFSSSVSGWSTSYGWLGAILIIAAGAYLVAQRSGVNLGKLPVGPAVIVLGAATLGALIVILRWITIPSGSNGIAGFSYGPRIGLYFTLLAGIVQAVCAFLLFRASGEPLPWAASTPPVASGFQPPADSGQGFVPGAQGYMPGPTSQPVPPAEPPETTQTDGFQPPS